MQFTTLVGKLNEYSPKLISKCTTPTEIYSYELYDENTDFQQGVAYVCNYSMIPDTAPPGTSFLCAETPDSAPYTHADANIAAFNTDIMTLLRKAGNQITVEHKLHMDKQTMIDALNSGKGLQNLINTAYEMLKSPIIIIDNAYKLLAMSKPALANRPDLERQRQFGYVESFNIEEMKKELIYERTRNATNPYYAPKTESSINNTAWMHVLIPVYGIEAALLSVMELDHSFKHYDYEITSFLSKLVSTELQKNDFYKSNRALMHSLFMADLLEGQLHDDTVIARVKQLGWSLSDEMYLMTIFDRYYGIFDHKAQLICNQIQILNSKSRWAILENKIVFLLILSRSDDTEALWDSLREYLKKNKLTAAVSDRFSDIYSIRWKNMQCEAAFDIGSDIDPDGLLYFYGDYSLHHIGSVALEKFPKSVFFHPGVIAMEVYDKENGTNLLETVKEYLNVINDPGVVASKLFIHKNTLFYRIKKAKELFDLDLNSGYERMRISMTILMMAL